jgi:hypothetical protein
VDLVAAVVADEKSLVVVEPSEGALNDPPHPAESGAVLGSAASDLRFDAAGTELAPILVVVVAAVGGDAVGPPARSADLAAYRRDALDERDELGDVVAVAAGHRPGERDPGRVYEKMMLRAVSGSINRARARRGAPFFA